MTILITGTTGYIAKRLIPVLKEAGHELICCVRNRSRIPEDLKNDSHIQFEEVDFLAPPSPDFIKAIQAVDAAYYLIHSMGTKGDQFTELEKICAQNFKYCLEHTQAQQLIFLSGISNANTLSQHLQSRLNVELYLASQKYALTTLRAGIIVGSGSASFDIIRDLVEKLPVMVAPKWLNTPTQPIAIRDVLYYLTQSLLQPNLYNGAFDIFGPETLTYKTMLLQFGHVRGLKRTIITLPVLSPKLSSYWLYFVTATSYNLAQSLVDSMHVEIIGQKNKIHQILPHKTLSYQDAVIAAFSKIAQNEILSSWKDSKVSGVLDTELSKHIHPPKFGCFKDIRSRSIQHKENTLEKIWKIGGNQGWYAFNGLWKVRGWLDQLTGGVGLRRGRRHPFELETGDALDFWRVLLADKENGRLLLYAEMKLPGEAWLEFSISDNRLWQKAIFRPKGLCGRLYWYAVLPFHGLVFNGMINALK